MLHLLSARPHTVIRPVRRAVPLLFVLVGLLSTACGDAPPPGPPVLDLGPRDLAVDLGRDLGTTDLGQRDGGADAAVDGGMVVCEVEAPDMLGMEANGVTQRIAVTNLVNDFAVVFRENRTGFDDLWARVYRDTPTGVVRGSDFVITTDAAGSNVGSVSRDPAIVAVTDGYIVAWIDSREQGFEMWTRVLGMNGLPTATLQRVTTLEGAAESPALARSANGALIAGHIHNIVGTVTTSEWHVASMGTTGALTGTWTRLSSAGEFAVQGMLVPGRTEGFLSGWVDGTNGNARVRPVSASGAPAGAAVTHGSAELFGVNATALVFARNQGFNALRAQPITATGDADGLERSALSSDASGGRDPGVASLNGGVVIAYRHTTTSGTVIALALLNSRGERVHTELLEPTTLGGGPVSVAVNNEGRIRLAWAEVAADTTTTYTQAVQCSEAL